MLFTTKRSIGNVIAYIIVTVAVVTSLFPLYWIFATSLKTRLDFLEFPPKFFLFRATLSSFYNVFVKDAFYNYIINSFIVVTGAVILALVIGTLAAYSLARFEVKGGDKIAFFILGIRMLPAIVVILPIYILFKGIHLLDTHLALVLVYTLLNLPLITWVLRAFFLGLPKEIEESAMLDGHSTMKILWRISLPLVKPGVIAVAILSFMITWNEFFFAYILASRSAKTAPVAAVTYVGMRGIRWGETCAASVAVVIPMIIILFIIQKHLVRGLTFGAVKG